MKLDMYLDREEVDATPVSIGIIVVGLVVLFWLSIPLDSLTVFVGVVRSVVGTTLLIVMGVLLTRLLGVPASPIGRFALYTAGSSLAALAVLTITLSILLPLVGVVNPLSVVPLTAAVSALLFGLLFVIHITDTQLDYPNVALIRRPSVIVLLCILPVLAVVAALLMNHFGVNMGMFVFVGSVVVVVLGTTYFVPTRLYPAVLFSVSVATLLHHNLLSNHVIGADVQGIYFVAHFLTQTHQWTPVSGSTMALPVVSTVPAAFSLLTGIDLTTTFTVVYVLVFALVPLGIFYVSRDVFDSDIALLAALLFLFYHVTFAFTPSKQLLSELFAVLLVMLVVRDDLHKHGHRRNVAVFLLSFGLVATHYGTTYLFGFALLFAAIVSYAVDRLVGEIEHRPPVWYPVALLVGANVWYAYASPELFARLVSVPLRILGQVFILLSGSSIEGSGVSYVSHQTTLLGTLTVVLYLLFSVLICVGVGWRILTTLSAFRRGKVPDDVAYTALSIPVCVFLGLSFVLVFNLWADRVYQMALVFLAPFMPLGYRCILSAASTVSERVWSIRLTSKRAISWTTLAVLLGLLFALNSGLLFALAGPAQNSAFNTNANDLVFSQKEVQGVEWLKTHIDPTVLPNQSTTANHSGAVRIYVDPRSSQLFRSILPENHYDVKVIRLKSRWRPEVHPDQLNDGYVVIRQASIANAQQANASSALISKSNVRKITARGTVVFRNNQMRIIKIGSDVAVDKTDQRIRIQ
jgi:uncharacterized membrane protein